MRRVRVALGLCLMQAWGDREVRKLLDLTKSRWAERAAGGGDLRTVVRTLDGVHQRLPLASAGGFSFELFRCGCNRYRWWVCGVGDGDEWAVLRVDKRDPVWGPWNNTYRSGATC